MSAKPLPPPTLPERRAAQLAARALRAVLRDKTLMGARPVMHVDFSRPRRAEWLERWDGLPGFWRVNGRTYRHDLLPGWEYTRQEAATEMIEDLEALAERGIRPTTTTRKESPDERPRPPGKAEAPRRA